MSHLQNLFKHWNETDRSDINRRTILTLEMMEYVITESYKETIIDADIDHITSCVHEVTRMIDQQGDHLFAYRIQKIWKRRDHIIQLAKNAHKVKKDYMDALEYHEEIKWIRTMKEKISSEK